MEKNKWYVVKVLPGKERKLNEKFNKQIELGQIKYIKRFVCPTEKESINVKNKKVLREKVLYSGYLYFEAKEKLSESELKVISSYENIMSIMGNKIPMLLGEADIRRILKDDKLENHIESKKIKFPVGSTIKLIDGPFSGFFGKIAEVKEDKVDIIVKIFERDTPLTVEINQISNNF